MQFSSPIFLFGFLPVFLLFFFFLNQKYRFIYILLASILFYFWAEGASGFILLALIWFNFLLGRKLAAEGIGYFFLVAPSKMTIYPEKVPGRIKKIHKQSRLDQLLHYLRNHNINCLVDVRAEILAAKAKFPVYFKTGSHCNQYGAYIANRVLIAKLLKRESLSGLFPGQDFRFKRVDALGNDYPLMLGLQYVIKDQQVRVLPEIPFCAYLSPFTTSSANIQHSYSVCKKRGGFKAIMVHDSFIGGFKRLFAEHFDRVDYFWDYKKNLQRTPLKPTVPMYI